MRTTVMVVLAMVMAVLTVALVGTGGGITIVARSLSGSRRAALVSRAPPCWPLAACALCASIGIRIRLCASIGIRLLECIGIRLLEYD